MKKIGVLVFIILMMTVATVAQADVRAGGLPAVAGVSSDTAFTQAGPRAGGLPAITMDERIPNCTCKTDPSSCPKPVVAAPAPVVVPPPAPEPAPVVASPAPVAQPVIIEKGRQTLYVEFDTNKSIIKKDYYKDIDDLAGVMKKYPDLNVVIEGHTDDRGEAAYNKKLSEERTDAVKKYMVEKGGIDGNRIKAEGFGEEKPIASNKTKEGREKNRRVEAAVDYIIEK
jgi:outer membrane protein OmpA-like peptidoglycan-associated protein